MAFTVVTQAVRATEVFDIAADEIQCVQEWRYLVRSPAGGNVRKESSQALAAKYADAFARKPGGGANGRTDEVAY